MSSPPPKPPHALPPLPLPPHSLPPHSLPPHSLPPLSGQEAQAPHSHAPWPKFLQSASQFWHSVQSGLGSGPGGGVGQGPTGQLLQLPVFHFPVEGSHVTERVWVPRLLQPHFRLESGFLSVHSQSSGIEQSPHSLQVPVVVSQVLVSVPPFLHPHARVEGPSQVFGGSSAEHSSPIV